MQLSLGMSDQDEEWAPSEDNQNLEKSLKDSAESLLQKHVEALEETYRLLNQESFEGFLERMEKARRIFFFGVSDSQLIAQEAGNKFHEHIGKGIQCIRSPYAGSHSCLYDRGRFPCDPFLLRIH